MIEQFGLSQSEIALVGRGGGAGGIVLSHVNDSGFWLFNRYMDIDIPITLKSWTMMETLIGPCAFLIAAMLSGMFALT